MIQKRVIAAVSVVAAAGLLLVGCANQAPSGGSTSSSSKVDIPTIKSVDVPKDAVLPAGNGKATLKTVEGGTLTAMAKGSEVWLTDEKGGKSKVTIADVYQSNGVIHVIDTVAMPA